MDNPFLFFCSNPDNHCSTARTKQKNKKNMYAALFVLRGSNLAPKIFNQHIGRKHEFKHKPHLIHIYHAKYAYHLDAEKPVKG